jgi:hypothetical protein
MGEETKLEDIQLLKLQFAFQHTKFIKNRLKVLSIFGNLFDDFADVEQTVGKGLTRVYESCRQLQCNTKTVSLFHIWATVC